MVFLGLLVVLSVWLVNRNEDVLNVEDPVATIISTLKEDPQMINVFIDRILSDEQLKREFLHHPWIIESLEVDSLFIRQQVDLLQRDSLIADYFFYQLSNHRKPMTLLIENLYRNNFINNEDKEFLLDEISQRRMIDDLN